MEGRDGKGIRGERKVEGQGRIEEGLREC